MSRQSGCSADARAGVFPTRGVDPMTAADVPEWQRNAAGTVSAVETEISEMRFGGHALGGIDYDLTERVALASRYAYFVGCSQGGHHALMEGTLERGSRRSKTSSSGASSAVRAGARRRVPPCTLGLRLRSPKCEG